MDQNLESQQLQQDIDLFTRLLGDVLRQHSRKRVLVMVERLREGFLELRRQEDAELRGRLIERIESLDHQTLGEVIRAFNIYFGPPRWLCACTTSWCWNSTSAGSAS